MTLLTPIVRAMKMIRPLAVAASLTLVLAACGSDDDSSADTTAAATDTTVATDVTEAPDAVESTVAATETTEVVPAGPLATLTVNTDDGDVVVEAAVVECTIEEDTVSFTAQGETSEMVVTPLYGTYVGLEVTGDFEFEASGDTVLDGTTVTVTGSGMLADPSLPTANFVLEADLSAC